MLRNIGFAIFIAFIALGITAKSPAVDGHSIPVESLVDMQSFPFEAPVSLSSDGTWVAYTLVHPPLTSPNITRTFHYFTSSGVAWQADKAEVWIANVRTHKQFQISPRGSSSWDPVWSPDDASVAFYSDAGGTAALWIWDLDTKRAHPIPDAHTHAFGLPEVPVWSRDSQFVFVKLITAADETPPPSTNDQVALAPLVFDSEPGFASSVTHDQEFAKDLWAYANLRSDLARIDIKSGRVSVLHKADYIARWLASPNGRFLAFAAIDGLEMRNVDLMTYTLWLIDLSSGQQRALGNHLPIVMQGYGISWSPDGTELAYVGRQRPAVDSPVDCYVQEVNKVTAAVRVTVNTHLSALGYFSVPVWTSNGATILLNDSQAVYVINVRDGQERVIHMPADRAAIWFFVSHAAPYVPPAADSIIHLWEQNTKSMNVELHCLDFSSGVDTLIRSDAINLGNDPPLYFGVSRDGSLAVYQRQATDDPPDLWSVDDGFSRYQRITSTNPQLTGLPFSSSRIISWRSLDGEELHGSLLLPPKVTQGTPLPLLIEIYGGVNLTAYVNQFGMTDYLGVNNHIYVSRGYAVLAVDTPLHNGTPILDLFKDVLPVCDKVIELGIGRADALGLMGGSYGGYGTLGLITQTERFKAAAAIAASGDLIDMTTSMSDDGSSVWFSWAEQGQGRMGGTPWQYRDRYIENSPLFYADRIHTPVLLVAGQTDDNAVRGSRAVFSALHYLHRKAQYAEYPGGGHMPQYWTRDQQVDFVERMLSWFDRFLKDQK
jgi:dipeptidyl aminopeptidase/acylaminoacyl peptidase